MRCEQCGAEVKVVPGPGSNDDVRCTECPAAGAVLRDGRATGPVFASTIYRDAVLAGGDSK